MESIVMVVLKATEAWDTHQKERAKQLGMALQTAETGHSEQPRENEWAWAGTVRGQEDVLPLGLRPQHGNGASETWACSQFWSWVEGHKSKTSSAPHLPQNKQMTTKAGETGGCEQCKTCGGAAGPAALREPQGEGRWDHERRFSRKEGAWQLGEWEADRRDSEGPGQRTNPSPSCFHTWVKQLEKM